MTDVQAPPFRTLAFVDGDFREAATGQRFATENPFLAGETVVLTNVDQSRPNGKMAEREGFEPPVPLRVHVLSKHAH